MQHVINVKFFLLDLAFMHLYNHDLLIHFQISKGASCVVFGSQEKEKKKGFLVWDSNT